MELLQLRYFRTVARLESISKAAEFYHIPQPAMSQTIAKLERELGGVKLFDRKNRRLYLNDTGKLFLEYVDQALSALDNGVRAVSLSQAEICGPVRVLAMENRRFIFSCVSKFAENHPSVNFHISHDYDAGGDRSFDLCIASSVYTNRMQCMVPLVRERIVLALHEEHPLASKEQVSLMELKDEKFITMSSRASINALTFEKCREAGFEPQVPFICDDPYFVRKYISERMGIAMAPEVSWAGRFRENTRLIPFDDPTMVSTSYLMWDDTRYLSPAVCAFREYLLNAAKDIPGNMLYEAT